MSAVRTSRLNQAVTPGAWRIGALLIAFSFASWFNRVSVRVAYDTKLGHEFGISEEAIGTVYSAFFLSYLLFMTPGGWFIDRWFSAPRRRGCVGAGVDRPDVLESSEL